MMNSASLNIRAWIVLALVCLAILLFSPALFAQTGLEGRINDTIRNLVRIINIIIVGFVAWSGFLIAKGDQSGLTRLIYGVIGLLVVNSAYLIIDYFNF